MSLFHLRGQGRGEPFRPGDRKKGEERKAEAIEGGWKGEGGGGSLYVACLTSQQHASVSQETDLFRQLYVLQH